MNKLVSLLAQASSHPLARGSAIVFGGSMLSNVLAYGYHVVVGRMLGPDRYGELASLFSFSYMLNVPALVFGTILTRYMAEFKAKQEFGRAKSLALRVTLWLFLITGVGLLILVPFIPWITHFLLLTNPATVVVIYITSALLLFGMVQTSLLQGFQRFTDAMVFANISAVLRLIGGAIGALWGVTETVVAGVVTSLVGYGLYFFPLRFVLSAPSRPHAISLRSAVSFAVPTLLATLGITSLYSTDILLAKHYLSATDAGLYAALSVMGKIIFFASSSVVYVLFPVVAERTKQGRASKRLVFAAVGAVALLSGFITFGYFLFPRLALNLLFGSSYDAASAYLGWFGVFISLFAVANLLMTTLLGSGKTGVWRFVFAAAVIQVIAIVGFHATITAIILVNIAVTAVLFVSLLLYYRHAHQA